MLVMIYGLLVFVVLGLLGAVGESVFKGMYGHHKWLVGGGAALVGGDKGSSYECGFVDMNESLNTYTMQFYIIGLSFMLFDLEILIIIPVILVGLDMWGAVVGMSLFLMVVSVAAYYEVLGGVVEFF
uniref:NADH-ubiquinone oxidoreductase chain 3 n=1 Tax=Phallusia fumigata TaxID=395376 RepID=A7WL89_9ASCI|nr:NADH dehydrogenase subunit 3 [Phallusia fumigata]CAL24357.1 NADH dehydrogenase subunit 3 [Phallusia fumigata]